MPDSSRQRHGLRLTRSHTVFTSVKAAVTSHKSGLIQTKAHFISARQIEGPTHAYLGTSRRGAENAEERKASGVKVTFFSAILCGLCGFAFFRTRTNNSLAKRKVGAINPSCTRK